MAFSQLFKPRWKSSDALTRQKAAYRLKNQRALAFLAQSDESHHVRVAATRGLSDPSLIARIAVEDRHPEVRQEAVRKLADPSLVLRIALGDADPGVRWCAVKRIALERNVGNESMIAELARTSRDWDVRAWLVKDLSDAALLAEIARSDTDWRVRRDALRKAGDTQGASAETARHAPELAERLTAIRAMSDRAILAEIARGDDDCLVRMAALRTLGEEEALVEELVRNQAGFQGDHGTYAVLEVAGCTEGEDLLVRIARTFQSESVVSAVARKLEQRHWAVRTQREKCDACGGTGTVYQNAAAALERDVITRDCPGCGGTGGRVTVRCMKNGVMAVFSYGAKAG